MNLPDLIWKAEFCVQFQVGQTILKEGETGNTLLILLEGQVEVHVRGQLVGLFEPVEIFGEMAVIDSQPRSATVIAKKNSKLARIDQNRFKFLIQKQPEFGIDIMRMLVERMRWMDSVAAKQAASAVTASPDGLQKELEGLTTTLETATGQIGQLLQKLRGS